jgi:Putative peptidoglycan binding domain
MLKFILLLLIICQINSVATAQRINGIASEPGKCYAQCRLPDTYAYNTKYYYIYTGTDIKSEFVKSEKIIYVAKSKELVKKVSSKPCRSLNPEDCMVWQYENIKEKSGYAYIVTDTSKIKEFRVDTIHTKKFIKSNMTEWKEIICDHKINSDLISKIKYSLAAKGYDVGNDKNSNIIDGNVKAALKKFQKDNGLTQGILDFETIKLLGIEF